MKRILKIVLLSLLALIIIGAAIICITQWDNIQAAIIGIKYDEEEIDQMQVDSKIDFAEKTGIDLDAIEAMAATITPEGDIIDPASGKSTVPEGSSPQDVEFPSLSEANDPSTEKPQESDSLPGQKPIMPQNPTSNAQGRDTSKVEAILARFYALRNSYTAQLEGIRSDAYAQYKALPKEERGTAAKIRLGKAAVARATALESQCDAKVNALLKELRAALKEAGMSEELVNDVRYYYASEKSLLKAQYMSKYKKYLS